MYHGKDKVYDNTQRKEDHPRKWKNYLKVEFVYNIDIDIVTLLDAELDMLDIDDFITKLNGVFINSAQNACG